jgi:ribosome-dependent ATPase
MMMTVVSLGINLDIDNLSFAVIDRDQTSISRDYISRIAGSPYFTERPPILDYKSLDQRMRSGEIALAIEIPPGFARNIERGVPIQIGAWIDGAMPQRAETALSYLQGMHATWLDERERFRESPALTFEPRFRYNPN